MRRSLVFVGLVLVAVPALAGCMTVQATAMRHRNNAEARAKQWDPNAELAGIVGVEGGFAGAWMAGYMPFQPHAYAWSASTSYGGQWGGGSGWNGGGGWGGGGGSGPAAGPGSAGPYQAQGSSDRPAYWSRTADDGNVGDGRCEFWVYAYVADGRQDAYFVVVDRDGEVLDEGTADRDADMVAVGQWTVDSDRALEIAKEANQGIREGAEADNFSLVSVLGREPGDEHARWLIAGGGGDASGGGGGMVVIDAVTGDVLASHGGFGSR